MVAPISTGSYRDIAVHLDGMPEDEVRLAHAEALAARFGAKLTGIFTNVLPDPALFAGDFGMTALGEMTDASRREADEASARLKQRFTRLGVPNELRRIDAFPGVIEDAVATEARWADLFVASCPRGDDGLTRWTGVIERVMFDGGRGLCLVPPAAKVPAAIATVLVGWVDARPSARAVAEALPLLAGAENVQVATVQEVAHGRLGGAETLVDIAAHLDRHGISTTLNVLPEAGAPAAALLDLAYRLPADLIVVGAYGHSRFREWVLGGVTADLLQSSDVPLLMAH